MPTMTNRLLYTWHLIDGLTHVLLESTYIYNCFTSYIELGPRVHSSSSSSVSDSTLTLRAPFLGHHDRLYGNAYADNFFATIWRNYAEADARYAGVDLTTLSLEIITVFLAGPLALYVANCVRRDMKTFNGVIDGPTWFWATILASTELYGGYVLHLTLQS